MRQQLIRRKIPGDLWDYYLKSPEHWDFEDATEEGLQKGIKAILMSPNTVVQSQEELREKDLIDVLE